MKTQRKHIRHQVGLTLALAGLISALVLPGNAASQANQFASSNAGDLDPTFGNKGKMTTNFGSNSYASAVARQADGKLVVSGVVGSGNFGMARYNEDGTLDSTFGVCG